MRGFEPASWLVSDRVRTAGETRGFAVARLLTHWAEIAGEDLARKTRPVKIGYASDGIGATLTLLTTAAEAPMVQMQLPKLKERVNAVYGYAAITHIHLTQTAATGFAEGQAEFDARPGQGPARPGPRHPDPGRSAGRRRRRPGLRSALETLTRNS